MYEIKFIKMDDFLTGAKSFDSWFSSYDESSTVHNNDGSYRFVLRKPLESADELEIGIKQIILKSPFNSILYNITYNESGKKASKVLNLSDIGIPLNTTVLTNTVNNNIPTNLKQYFSFDIQEDGYVNRNVKDTQIQIQNKYLADALGFSKEKISYPEMNSQIRG